MSANTIERLQRFLRPVAEEQGTNAAVAVILRAKESAFEVLLVKRVKNPTDPWSGQMALPGGKRNPNDKSLKGTIIREILEEIGVKINKSQFLGVLEVTESEPKPGIKILPFVLLLKDDSPLSLNPAELERFLWISFEELLQSKCMVEFSFGKVPAYVFADAVVWGITYGILTEFFEALESCQE